MAEIQERLMDAQIAASQEGERVQRDEDVSNNESVGDANTEDESITDENSFENAGLGDVLCYVSIWDKILKNVCPRGWRISPRGDRRI